MSDGTLVPQEMLGGALAPDGSFDGMVSGGDYLGRLQLFSTRSRAVAEGKIPQGHYGLSRDDNIVDLGPEVELVFVSWRSKAVQSGDDFIVHYKPDMVDGEITNPTFKRIAEMSNVKDSGCMYGPEFLVWIPSVRKFATYHLNSKTGRREAKNMAPLLGKAATLKCKLIPSKQYAPWHGPVVVGCSAELEMPSEAAMKDEWTKFQNPPETELEDAAEDGRKR